MITLKDLINISRVIIYNKDYRARTLYDYNTKEKLGTFSLEDIDNKYIEQYYNYIVVDVQRDNDNGKINVYITDTIDKDTVNIYRKNLGIIPME